MPTEETTKTKYKVEGFDIVAWHEEFWQDESDSVMNHMSAEDFIELGMLDMKLLAKHDADGTDYAEVSETCKSIGGMMLLVRLRTLALGFKCTEGVCAFIQQISRTPGKAVMFCTALALAWEQRERDMLAHLIGDPAHDDIPSMNWIANMFNSGFVVGQKDSKGPYWLEADTWGIPGEEHLRLMWDKQKRKRKHRPGSFEPDNYLDLVQVVNLP